MAVTYNDEPNANEGAAAAATPSNNNSSNTTIANNNPLGLLKLGGGSNHVTEYASKMLEIIAGTPDAPKILILDNSRMTNLEYSYLVVHQKLNNVVTYFIVVMEESGRPPQTALEIANIVEDTTARGMMPFIFTTSDAIDSDLITLVKSELTNVYGDKVPFIRTDGMVQNNRTNKPDVGIISAYNACRSYIMLETGTSSDISIKSQLQSVPNAMVTVDVSLNKETTVDVMDNPVRSDFVTSLNLTSGGKQYTTGINQLNSNVLLANVSGFLDFAPQAVHTPQGLGLPPRETITGRTQIIIDEVSPGTNTMTLGGSLLAIMSSAIMVDPNMWVPALYQSSAKGKVRDIGALNIITNLENNANGIGSVLKIGDTKHTVDEAYALIQKMFTLDPVMCIDIEQYGPQTYYLSSIATAAISQQEADSNPSIKAARDGARKLIVKTLHTLTNSKFPLDYNTDQMFMDDGITVPLGIWTDKTGERDIRDIDTAFVARQTEDPAIVKDWAFSNLSQTVTGKDPFIEKVKVISKLVPNATITGKAVRVKFQGTFVSAMIQASQLAGMTYPHNKIASITVNSNMSAFDQYNTGGISGGAGINGAMPGSAGVSYFTQASTIGIR